MPTPHTEPTSRVVSRSERGLAAAELLCATIQGHKPFHCDGYYACNLCRLEMELAELWIAQGEALASTRAVSDVT